MNPTQSVTNQTISTMGAVDASFIQEPEHRPEASPISEAKGIPLIDLSGEVDDLVSQIGSACEKWGFFQVINHGVPPEALGRLDAAMKKFFALSPEEKSEVRRDEVKVLGYYETEYTKNVMDWKEVFDITIQDPTIMPASPDPLDTTLTEWTNQWPRNPPELRQLSEEYKQEMEKLALRLLEMIALSLGLPAKRFHGYFKDQSSFLRLNHYPPCPAPNLALGLGRHYDSCALTILAQDDVGGLEVKKSDGQWARVTPTPDAYVINVGDLIQVWSNDKYPSVEHRAAVNSDKPRFSIPFFFYPVHSIMVKPLEELTSEDNPPKYKEYNLGKFLAFKKVTNYKKRNFDNIQVHQFRLRD